jgi:hypothetical protein
MTLSSLRFEGGLFNPELIASLDKEWPSMVVLDV